MPKDTKEQKDMTPEILGTIGKIAMENLSTGKSVLSPDQKEAMRAALHKLGDAIVDDFEAIKATIVMGKSDSKNAQGKVVETQSLSTMDFHIDSLPFTVIVKANIKQSAIQIPGAGMVRQVG